MDKGKGPATSGFEGTVSEVADLSSATPKTIPPVDTVMKTSNYPLPAPPKGYRFRPILRQGHEFVGSLSLLSGRYYPRILSHPRLRETVSEALDRPEEDGGVVSSDNLWALEGLSGGFYNSMDPTRYKQNRVTMLQDADIEAMASLREYAEQEQKERQEAALRNQMDVDDDAADIYA